MTVKSGKSGTVMRGSEVIAHITKWMFEPSVAINKWNSNVTGGAKDGQCGPKDSKGSIEAKLDILDDGTGAGVPWGVGDRVTLSLLADANTPADSITVDAIIGTSPIEVDIDGGTPLSTKYDYEGVGAWTGAGKFANV